MLAIITSVIKEKRIIMSKLYTMSMIAALIVLLSGCGYKAPPYYEKPALAKESAVAL